MSAVQRTQLRSLLGQLDTLQSSLSTDVADVADALLHRSPGSATVPRLLTLARPLAQFAEAAWPAANRLGRSLAAWRAKPLQQRVASTVARSQRSAPDVQAALSAVLSQLSDVEAHLRLLNQEATVRAARRLNHGSAVLATSVLLDSAVEHYRGSFRNPAMYTPLVVSALTLAISAHGTADPEPSIHHARHAVAVSAALTGLAGTGFHLWNVLKRPGRLAWQNVFYGAPLGAPMAILLAGLLGTAAEWVRDNPSHKAPRLLGVPAGRMLAAIAGAGLLGTSGEAGLLHFRGAFQNPAMFIPVTLPPVAAGLLLNTAVTPEYSAPRLTRAWLWLTAGMGGAGVLFHAWGIHRAMGGWRNWSQNVLDGPPLPAPPSFTGLALAGLAALGLMREHPDA